MKKYVSLLGLWFALAISQAIAQKPVRLIYDTDFDSDVDDVGALGILHVLADAGEVNLLAVMLSSSFPYSGTAVSAVNTFYGRKELLIGLPTQGAVNKNSVYAQKLTETYPHTPKEEMSDAISLYRKILAGSPDNSVTILTVGHLTNIARLLNSTPDQYSPLKGQDLVKQKVGHWIAMTGLGVSWNLRWDMFSSTVALNRWPTKLSISPYGQTILTKGADKDMPEGPVKLAYEEWNKSNPEDIQGRSSWDLIAALYAVRSEGELFEVKRKGKILFSNGSATMDGHPENPHRVIGPVMTNEEIVKILEDLMKMPPKSQ